MKPSYVYRARLNRVIDGDTQVYDVDLGFRVQVTVTVRVRNLFLAESNTPAGKADTELVKAALASAKAIVLSTYKDQQTFSRWVADVWVDGVLLQETMGGKPPAGVGSAPHTAR